MTFNLGKVSDIDAPMLVKTAVERFLDGYFSTCQRSEKTIQAYTIDLRQFREYTGARARLEKLRPAVLESWAAELKTAGYASASIRRKFATLKVFFGYWVRLGTLETSPTWRIRLDLAPERRLPRILSADEVGRLLREAKRELGRWPRRPSGWVDEKFLALRNLAIVEVLFATGMRVGELMALRLEDVDLAERTLTIHGKGSRQRVGFLPDAGSHRALSTYMGHREHLDTGHTLIFVNTLEAPLSTQSAAAVVTRLARQAKIERRVTPHMLRHTVATLLLENGADIRVVQEFLGHAAITTTQRYTHVSRGHLHGEIRRNHPSLVNVRRPRSAPPP